MMSLRMKISPPVRLTWKSSRAGNAVSQGVERQFLTPFTFEVQKVADVAELAVQVAPHRRLVNRAGRQSIGSPGALGQETLNPALVLKTAIARPGMAGRGQCARAHRE